jgi:tRNA (Thr-GGU) A37 N-methylase
LRVLGLDALDGTSVLDIKPYLPVYDSVAEARLPEWAESE